MCLQGTISYLHGKILLQKSHLCNIISKHNSSKILEKKLPQVFSLLCNTSPCLLYISMHTHARDSCSTNLRTEQSI